MQQIKSDESNNVDDNIGAQFHNMKTDSQHAQLNLMMFKKVIDDNKNPVDSIK
jgi:hypothetical protein